MAVENEVVVAGAGPTGLMLACELALAGVRVVVLERLAERVEQVKGGGIQPRTAELLESRGLLGPLLAGGDAGVRSGGHFALLPVPLDCTPWRTRQAGPIRVPQWRIEKVLEERATAAGAGVVRDAAVVGVEEDQDGVLVSTAGRPPVRGRYLVACDGAHSTVRRLLGLPFPGRPGTHEAVLADIRLSAVSELVPREAGHVSGLTRRGGGHWSMLVPLGGDRYRITFGRIARPEPGAAGRGRERPVAEDEIAEALRAVYGPETVLGGVRHASRFGDATRQLEHYRVGRTFFAGDAAHIHPPHGGQGLNLGVQDAFNLGWKLAAVLQDRAPEQLLDSYHAERHPVAAEVLHHTSAQRVFSDPAPSEDVAALRDIFVDLLRLPDTNRHLAGLMSGLALSYPLPGEHPLTGHRVPDAELSTAAGQVRLSALFRSGHAVLLDLVGAVPDGVRERLPPRVDLVRAEMREPEIDLGAAMLLIRPDGYVGWASGPQPAVEGGADGVDGEALLGAVAAAVGAAPSGGGNRVSP